MLEQLSLSNIGGVAQCVLSLSSAFIVITGESGAGKSSIVRALELISGKRGQAALVRAGEEEARAEALFSVTQPIRGLQEALQVAEGNFFAERTVLRNGRGRAALQGTQVPLGLYASAVSGLIHIQSQFAQMELLDAHRQMAMVDSCGGTALADALRGLREIFERAKVKEQELKAIAERRSQIERLYANAAEIVPLVKKVDPRQGLEASLENEIAVLSRRLADKTKVTQALDRLTGGLTEQGLLGETGNVCRTLIECLPPAAVGECTRLLQEGLQSLQDLTETARRETGASPGALVAEIERLEHRLGLLRKLRRMANAKTEEELLAYCKGATESLEWLEQSYDLLEKSTQEARELRRQASALALEIRRKRQRAAEELEKRVNVLFKDLAMDGIGFALRFVELPKLRRDGADAVEFTLFTDKREGRVDKIASGGELSRLLLALQLSLPDAWLPPTLVFDEVEAGLGGKAAVLSGLKLQELARKCQVLLVTHEASIAALGTEHYVVRKKDGESVVLKVEGEERIHELARMLSGDPDLPEAREHARRLLKA